MNLNSILSIEKEISTNTHFQKNTKRKNFFLACCLSISSEVDLLEIDRIAPFGGLIGIGDSTLETVFGGLKCFRMHAVLHDASGFMKTTYSRGVGYCYVFKSDTILPNSCLLGHITGLVYCLYLKFYHSKLFSDFDV